MNTAMDILEKYKASVKDTVISEAFDDYEQRIYALSSLSQLLSAKNMKEDVSMSSYLKQITKNLAFNAHPELHQRLKVTYSFCKQSLPSKDALNVALIITELFTNSLKHAFQNIEEPVISIQLQQAYDNSLKLQYTDNGSGVIHSSDGEGMHLISSLIQYLGGEGKIIQNKNGFHYEALFPKKLV